MVLRWDPGAGNAGDSLVQGVLSDALQARCSAWIELGTGVAVGSRVEHVPHSTAVFLIGDRVPITGALHRDGIICGQLAGFRHCDVLYRPEPN